MGFDSGPRWEEWHQATKELRRLSECSALEKLVLVNYLPTKDHVQSLSDLKQLKSLLFTIDIRASAEVRYPEFTDTEKQVQALLPNCDVTFLAPSAYRPTDAQDESN